MFKDNGYTVYVATNSDDEIKYCDKKINLYITRKTLSFKNIKALFKLKRIVKKECFDII